MDPEITALLEKARTGGRAPFWQLTPQAARERPSLMSLLFGPAPALHQVRDLHIAGPAGASVAARLYLPAPAPAGLIVYFHGGGWVVGSVAGSDPLAATLAQRTGLAVLSVDYRLAPEHRFPAAVEDARLALRWAAQDAAQALGAAPRVLMVMGDSAGANLATVAARSHNAGRPARPVDLQVLTYPVISDDFDRPSYGEFGEGFLLTRRDMQWFWDQYVPDRALRTHPDVAPLHAPDLAASPPAYIVAAGCDPLRDEALVYAQRLRELGVPVRATVAQGLVHGFLALAHHAPSAGRALDDIVTALRAVAPPPVSE